MPSSHFLSVPSPRQFFSLFLNKSTHSVPFFLPRNQWSRRALKSLRFFIKISDHEHYKNTGLLKSFPCPACKYPGNLIWNGLRYGGPEKSNFNPAVRGYRVFCSNRYNNKGCGHSYTVYLSCFLHGLIFRAQTLWLFLKTVLQNISLQLIPIKKKLPFSPSTAFRLWKRFLLNLSHIRSFLIKITSPPASREIRPEMQTIAHIQTAFPNSVCPITDFQSHFQENILEK